MADKRYRKGIGAFDDLLEMSYEELSTRVNIVQRMITKKERRERIDKLTNWRIYNEGQIRRLEKQSIKLEKYFNEIKKYKRIHNQDEFAENEEEYWKIQAKIKDIESQIEEAITLEQQEKDVEKEERKWTQEERKMLSDYVGLSIHELARDGKRTFIYSLVRDEFDPAYEIAHEYEISEQLDNQQKTLEQYFEEFEKKKIISFKDKEEYKEMEEQYQRVLAVKKDFHQRVRKLREERKLQGIDEEALLLESNEKAIYYTDENNWDIIIDEIIRSQEEAKPEKSNIISKINNIFRSSEENKQENNYIPYSKRHKILGKIFGKRMDEKEAEIREKFIDIYGEEPRKDDIFWAMHPRLEVLFFKGRTLPPEDKESEEYQEETEVTGEGKAELEEIEVAEGEKSESEETRVTDEEQRRITQQERQEKFRQEEEDRKRQEAARLEEILLEQEQIIQKMQERQEEAQEVASPMEAKRQEFLQEYSLDSNNQPTPVVDTNIDSNVKIADIPENDQKAR